MIDAVAVLAAIGTLLGGIITAGLARKWVWGYQLSEMTADRDFWRHAFLRSVGQTDQAIQVVNKVTRG